MVSPVCLGRSVLRGRQVSRVALVLREHRAHRAILELLALPEILVLLGHRAILESPVSRVSRAHRVTPDRRVLRDLQVQLVPQALQDHQAAA